MENYILYATKNDKIFYISNTYPLIWNGNLSEAKLYNTRYAAECDILKDYNNYNLLYNQIQSKAIDSIYVAMIVNMKIIEKYKIL